MRAIGSVSSKGESPLGSSSQCSVFKFPRLFEKFWEVLRRDINKRALFDFVTALASLVLSARGSTHHNSIHHLLLGGSFNNISINFFKILIQ